MSKQRRPFSLSVGSATESVRAAWTELKTIAGRRPHSAPVEDPADEPSGPTEDSTVSGEKADTLGKWGRLDIRARVGGGAFGTVYRAWDPSLRREVALKVIRLQGSNASAREEVIREARMLAQLRNPNVVTIYDVIEQDDEVGLCMEYVKGQNLEQLVREQGRLSAREAAMLGVDITRALAAVHADGLLHRDVKAQNVMREEGGRVVLMDFGLGEEERGAGSKPRMLAGTPLYMAPELLSGGEATRQTDIYALGVLLYRAVSGQFPVKGSSVAEVKAAHESGELTLLRDRRPDLPEGFVAAVERALATDPGERFPTAGAMQQALATALHQEAVGEALSVAEVARARWTRRAVIAGCAAAVIGVGGYYAWTAESPPPLRIVVADVQAAPGLAAEAVELQRHLVSHFRDSTAFELPSSDDREEMLSLMRRASGTPVNGEVGRTMAVREGASLLIEPQLRQFGDDRVVTLTVKDPENGSVVIPEIDFKVGSEHTKYAAALAGSMDLLEREIGRIGFAASESRPVYPRVTTSSLDALRAYRNAIESQSSGQMRDWLLLLERAVALDPEFASAHDQLSDAYATHGQAYEAFESAVRAFRLVDGISQEEGYRIAGNYYSHMGDFEQARSRQELLALLLTERMERTGDDTVVMQRRLARVHRRVAQLSIRLARPQSAIQSMKTALEFSDGDVLSYGLLALNYARAGDIDAARSWAAKAHELFPGAAYPHWAIALTRYADRDFDGALQATEELAKGGGLYTYHAHLIQIKIHAARGQWVDAERNVHQGARAAGGDTSLPINTNHTYLEARIAARNSDQDRAAKLLSRLTDVPRIPANALLFRKAARLAVEMNNAGQAEEIAVKVRSMRDEFESPVVRREADLIDSMLALERGDRQHALELAFRANTIMPAPSTSWALAQAQAANGETRRAVAALEDYVEAELVAWRHHFPADITEARLQLGELHQQLGNTSEAIRHYKAFLALWDPDRHSDREILERASAALDALAKQAGQRVKPGTD